MIMPGLINLDFADVRAVMGEMGKAMMGTGEAEGEKRAIDAAEAAISNPLLDDVSMKGAKGVLINITGGIDMTLFEVDEAANRIREEVDPEANIIFGSTFDEGLAGRMRVSVVATGIEAEAIAGQRPPVAESDGNLSRRFQPDEAPVALAAVGGTALAAAVAVDDVEPVTEPVAQSSTAARVAQRLAGAMAEPATQEPQSSAQTGLLELTEAIDEPRRNTISRPAKADKTADKPTLGAAGDGPYIAPKPMQPSRRRVPAGRPEAFAEAAVTNGSGAGPEKRTAANLLQRITRSGRARQIEPETTPIEKLKAETVPTPPKPAPVAEPVENDLIKPAPEEDLLDIPAFLRRQAN
jgi:cell division protein FtsZ